MVTNTSNHPSRDGTAAHKHVKLKAHHSKAYRKRHVGLLLVSIAALVLLGVLLVAYRHQIVGGLASSRSFVSDLFEQNKTYDTTISSSYGFHLSYDQKQFYASGIDSASGDLHIGTELTQERPYTVVRIAPNFTDTATRPKTTSALTVTYHSDKASTSNIAAALDTAALQDGGIDATKVDRISTIQTTLADTAFRKTVWQTNAVTTLAPSLRAKFVTYSGIVRGNVVTMVISLGVGKTTEATYTPVLNTLSFDTTVSAVATPSRDVVAKVDTSRSLLDTITNTNVAAAATNGVDLTGSEKVAALYSPAVVKVYNAYCMDINIDGKSYLTDACSAESGSGFFVSQDGYIGTNGHVASTQPLDIVISDALSYYSTKGDSKYFSYLLNLTDLKQSDIPANATDDEALGIMIDALYKINPKRVTATNDVENLLVQVTAKNPDVATLLQDTKDRKSYTSTSVLPAKLAAADYRANDGYDGFKASDVAIIKVEGVNFPVVKLGAIDSVTQGADLSILGYPGNASDNGIVDSSSSEATLTTGKVSSIKNAAHSDKKLIETDTTIGHGNSGGPALDDDGSVVGIATYTADGSGDGDGVFNYIRDIKDLTDLAAAQHITFDTNSQTQAEWQKGITYFYSSHYSKALKSFQKVQSLYPNDSRVAEFITAAQKRIANGEDVADFPVIPVVVAATVIFLMIGFAVLLIVRHTKKHSIYNAGIAQGTVLPVGPGVATQRVFVSQNGRTVESPLILSTAPTDAIVQPMPQVSVAPRPAVIATASPVAEASQTPEVPLENDQPKQQ